ncbi:MAG: four helix bundle protein [Candidatus Omnitrophota bacterium]
MKKYDLEERTFKFAEKVRDYIDKLPKTTTNIEIGRQLVRSAGSVGANYIEANESLGKKDFLMRIKISRKEAKESRYWSRLSKPRQEEEKTKEFLTKESTELMNIFGSILHKST